MMDTVYCRCTSRCRCDICKCLTVELCQLNEMHQYIAKELMPFTREGAYHLTVPCVEWVTFSEDEYKPIWMCRLAGNSDATAFLTQHRLALLGTPLTVALKCLTKSTVDWDVHNKAILKTMTSICCDPHTVRINGMA